MKRKLFLLFGCISFCFLCDAQQNNIKSTLKPGFWSDSSVWYDNKPPADSDFVYLNYPIVIDKNSNCKFLRTNGYEVTVNPNIVFKIQGNFRYADDSLTVFDIPLLYNTDTLVASYTQGKLEYLFFGEKDVAGSITKVTSCQYKMRNTNDTIIHLVYNDSARVKTMYQSINGINDSVLFKFTYSDTLVFITKFFVNWNTDSVAFRSVSFLKQRNNYYSVLSTATARTSVSEQNLAGIASAFAESAVINLIVVSGSVVVGYLLAPVIGLAATTGSAIGCIAAFAIVMKANATELPVYVVPPPSNSIRSFKKLTINNPLLDDPKWTGIAVPVLVTESILPTPTEAFCTAWVLHEGNSPTIARGVCWSTQAAPTVDDNKLFDGAGIGRFNVNLAGLSPGTKYYTRPFSTNAAGTGYGAEVSFTTFPSCGTVTDIDGNIYNSVRIGTQCWLNENLKTTRYRNGTTIPDVTNEQTWTALTSGAYSNYNNLPGNGIAYGRLYNWYAVSSSAGLCPTGWHIPTDGEWATLAANLGGETVAAYSTKDLLYWPYPNIGATNSSGFTGRPWGSHGYGGFGGIGLYTEFWSSTSATSYSAWSRLLNRTNSSLLRAGMNYYGGNYCRCVKD